MCLYPRQLREAHIVIYSQRRVTVWIELRGEPRSDGQSEEAGSTYLRRALLTLRNHR